MHLHKNTVLFITLLTSVLLFSAGVAAIQFNPVQILDTRWRPVNFISSDNPALVNIAFNYTLSEGESFVVNSINGTALYPYGIYSRTDYSRLVPQCSKVNGTNTYSCTVKALTLKTMSNNITIIVHGKHTSQEGANSIIQNSTTLKMTIDNTKPIVTFLGTTTCHNKVCYISSDKTNKIQINLQDERATFEKANIGYRVGSKLELVDSCTGMICNGTTKIKCEDGQKVPLIIRQDVSKDDIGNKINYSSTELICDASPPIIKAHSVASELGPDTLVLGKDMIFEFNASDIASPTLNMVINAESVIAGNISAQCTKPNIEGTEFICRGIVKPAIDVPGEYEFKITIKDLAGKESIQTLKLNVLKTTNQTANNWKVAGVEQSATEFSRPNMEFERTLFAKVNFQPIGNTEIVSIKPDGNCYAKEQNKTGIDSDVVSVKLIAKQPTSIYMKVAIRENSDGRYGKIDNLSFECPVSIVSKKGNYYFSTPEKDNFSITIKLKDDKNIQQYHQNEIERITKTTEKLQKTVQTYETATNTIEQICMACAGVSTVNTLAGSIETMSAYTGIGTVAAQGLTRLTDGLQTISYTGVCEKLDKVCKALSCTLPSQSIVTDLMSDKLGGDAGIYKYAGVEDLSNSFDPYKSYVIAVGTMCVPAIMYHLNVYSGIQCSYLECITGDYIKYGQDISTCQQDKTFSECVFWVGGALDAVPIVSLIRDLSSRFGNILKDPAQIVGTLFPLACKGLQLEGANVHGLCVVAQEAVTSVKLILTLNDLAKQMVHSKETNPAANCEGVLDSIEYYKSQSQTGYGYSTDDYNPVKTDVVPTVGGKVSCAGRDCTYTTNSGQTYKAKVDADGKVYYYYGNKKITPSNMYTENIKDVDKSKITEINTPNIEQYNEYNRELERLQENYRKYPDQFHRQQLESYVASGPSNMMYNKVSDMSLESLEFFTEDLILELSKKSIDEVNERFSGQDIDGEIVNLANSLNTLADKEKAYGLAVKNNQMNSMNAGKNIENLKALENLDEKITKTADTEKKKELERQRDLLRAEIYKNEFDSDAYKTMVSHIIEVENNYDVSKEQYDDLVKQNSRNPEKVTAEDVIKAKEQMDAAERELKEETEVFDKFTATENEKLKTVTPESEKAKKTAADRKINDAKKAYRDARIEVKWEEYFGTATNTAMTAWGNADAIADLRNVLNIKWGLVNPESKYAQFADWLIDDVAHFEKGLCRGKIEPAERMGDTVIMNVEGNNIYSTGAQVGGRMAGPFSDGTKKYYEYWVQGNVVTSKNDGLLVYVVLVDSEGNEVNATQKIIGGEPTPLIQGEQYSFGRPSPFYFTDSNSYDKVCIVFGGGPISAYFNHVQGGNTDRLCQKLIVE